ncbi:MAG: hypothetical protein ABI680_02485 [Chthoniobacteraceae bacterium]
MRLLFHQILKDFRQTLWAFVSFIAVLISTFVCFRDPKDSSVFGFVISWGLHYLVELGLVCRIIHADSLTGSSAFWMSRPISRPFLLVSKSLGVTILVLCPLIAFIAIFAHPIPTPMRVELGILAYFVLLAAITPTLVAAIGAAVALPIVSSLGG